MATAINCGYALYQNGMTLSSLLARQFDCGVSVADAGSTTALTPLGGVYPAQAASLQVTAPVSGLSVVVAAGYCMVPSATAGAGGYRFGLMTSGSLTVAANSSGNPRIDLVVAQYHDLSGPSSFCDINIITGTPASSPSPPVTPSTAIPLAQVAVANAASNIVTANITDLRTFVAAPGGILPIPSAAAAPAGPSSLLMWNIATGALVQATPTAGQAAPFSYGTSSVTYLSKIANFTTAGSGSWTCPPGVTTAFVECWGAGGGGGGGPTNIGGGGGGGEYAAEPGLVVVPGTTYSLSVGSGGVGGNGNTQTSTSGTASSFSGTISVTAHGGGRGTVDPLAGAGGTGSANSVHYDGGAGFASSAAPGGGGGSASASGTGHSATSSSGASAVSGGGSGGSGGAGSSGFFGFTGGTGGDGSQPGGGGGGGQDGQGGGGGDGKIRITYQIRTDDPAFAYQGTGSSVSGGTVATVTVEADGSSDYKISWGVAQVKAATGTTTRAQFQILIDGSQVDETDTFADATGTAPGYQPSAGSVYYTSPAAGTRMSAGQHTITLQVTHSGGGTAEALSPWWLRAELA